MKDILDPYVLDKMIDEIEDDYWDILKHCVRCPPTNPFRRRMLPRYKNEYKQLKQLRKYLKKTIRVAHGEEERECWQTLLDDTQKQVEKYNKYFSNIKK